MLGLSKTPCYDEPILAGADFLLARSLAEAMQLSFVQISHQLAAASMNSDLSMLSSAQQLTHDNKRLIEQFIQTGQILSSQTALSLEPIMVGALVNDVSNSLKSSFSSQGISLKVHQRKTSRPLAMNRHLSAILVEHLLRVMSSGSTRVLLGIHQTKNGVQIGGFNSKVGKLSNILKIQEKLNCTQVVGKVGSENLSLYIAHNLATALGLRVRSSRHMGIHGLSITIPWSTQMALL